MRFLFFFALLFASLNLYADDCRSERVFNPDTHAFLKCKIDVVTPSYSISATKFAAPDFTDLSCLFYCETHTLIRIPYEGRDSTYEVSRSLINLSLAIRNRLQDSRPPEVFLHNFFARLLNPLSFSDSDEETDLYALWDLSAQSSIHQKDVTKQLPEKSYTLIHLESLSESDRSAENPLKCSVCQESIVDQLAAGKDVVQTHCVSQEGQAGNHIFCKDCLEEAYHYQQVCPACRGEIKPISISPGL